MLAGDGSTLNLPSSEDIEKYFGIHATTELDVKRYLARVLFIYDVLNDCVVSWRIGKMDAGETTMLKECLKTKILQSILILDRGFGHFCTIKGLLLNQQRFCVRLSIGISNFAKAAMANPEDDFITTWKPSEKEKENCKKNGLEHTQIKVRVIKVKLKTGETELLVTDLFDQNKYDRQSMRELYHLRWGVEEGFKNLKPKMKVEQFGSRKAEGVLQEFYAHVFFMNVLSLAGNSANVLVKERTKTRKLDYKYNWKNAFRYLRERIIDFLMLKDIGETLDRLIYEISTSVIALKPDRIFPRNKQINEKKGRITQIYK